MISKQAPTAMQTDPGQADKSIDLRLLLPHGEPMILIDAITRWDDNQIICTADSHLAKDNPLRQTGILSVYAGVEYAAQAMAVHARLTSNPATTANAPRKGFLAVASKLSAQVCNLDQFPAALIIQLDMIAANNDSSLYRFIITAAEHILLQGQLMAVMEEGENATATDYGR